jgi:hypothetical protein
MVSSVALAPSFSLLAEVINGSYSLFIFSASWNGMRRRSSMARRMLIAMPYADVAMLKVNKAADVGILVVGSCNANEEQKCA